MPNGSKPAEQDLRDKSYNRSFGTPEAFWVEDFTVDSGLTMIDQMEDGFPFSCTGQTQTDNAIDQDRIVYDPIFVYEKTCALEGHSTNEGCQIRNSMKAVKKYGLKTKEEDLWQAMKRRRGDYFNIYDDGGLDWFDGILNAMSTSKRAVSVGTPWFKEWRRPVNGIVSDFAYDGNPDHYSWHNWAIKGKKTIDGMEYLIGKPWLGRKYGDAGFMYLSREIINKALEIRGSIALICPDKQPLADATIGVGFAERIKYYLAALFRIKLLA